MESVVVKPDGRRSCWREEVTRTLVRGGATGDPVVGGT
jgi:hypothetical protein